MSHAYFFGYGSLVNVSTHDFDPVHPATARNWRRGWRHTTHRRLAYLTAIRAEGESIDGLIAPVSSEGWAALDLREAAYRRHASAHEIEHGSAAQEIAVYAIPPEDLHLPDTEHPVLLSYLDVVLQGYLKIYGEAGAQRFLETTDGWEASFLNDRAAPVYPRAQSLSADERIFVDDALKAFGCKVIAA